MHRVSLWGPSAFPLSGRGDLLGTAVSGGDGGITQWGSGLGNDDSSTKE
jgi:hypothetical protein